MCARNNLMLHITYFFLFVFKPGAEEICPWNQFKAECPSHQVISIVTAQYGRMSTNTPCVDRDYGYVGCYVDVKAIAGMMCAGRQECSFTIPNEKMDKLWKVDCPRDLTGYLNITHRCKQGNNIISLLSKKIITFDSIITCVILQNVLHECIIVVMSSSNGTRVHNGTNILCLLDNLD